jgi:endonuclease/exonuclease/phosphatase family metal-dependent hydrolase
MFVIQMMQSTSAVVLLSAWLSVFGAGQVVDPPPVADTVRVATYNIETGRIHGPDGADIGTNINKVVDVIRDLDVDFIGLQEVRGQAQASQIAQTLGYNYFYGPAMTGLSPLGNAIITRHPILASQNHLLPFEEWQQRAVAEVLTEVDGVQLRVFAAHLTFNTYTDKDDQIMFLMDLIASRSEPRILVGDFNDMDNRPNAYSPEGGFINLITGSGHGTILPSVPKMFDFHRKCAAWSQVRNDPPFFSLKTDWDPPNRDANTVSEWEPRVRIDHIFVSPEFYLEHPENVARTIDTSEIMARLFPAQSLQYVSDHRPIVADMVLPRPPVQLFLNPQEGRTILTVGESRTIYVGGTDARGNAVSLLKSDATAPLGDPARTARMVPAVTWTYTGSGLTLQNVDPILGYDPSIRGHKPSSGAVRITATTPGTGILRARIGTLEGTLNIRVIAESERYTYTAN